MNAQDYFANCTSCHNHPRLPKSVLCGTCEAESDEISNIIDNLTPAQEDLLQAAHGESIDTFVLDDDMPDAYEGWLMDLSLDQLKAIIKPTN